MTEVKTKGLRQGVKDRQREGGKKPREGGKDRQREGGKRPWEGGRERHMVGGKRQSSRWVASDPGNHQGRSERKMKSSRQKWRSERVE